MISDVRTRGLSSRPPARLDFGWRTHASGRGWRRSKHPLLSFTEAWIDWYRSPLRASWAGAAPDWELKVLEGVGHVPMMEAPDLFMETLNAWSAYRIASQPAAVS